MLHEILKILEINATENNTNLMANAFQKKHICQREREGNIWKYLGNSR